VVSQRQRSNAEKEIKRAEGTGLLPGERSSESQVKFGPLSLDATTSSEKVGQPRGEVKTTQSLPNGVSNLMSHAGSCKREREKMKPEQKRARQGPETSEALPRVSDPAEYISPSACTAKTEK
jgi:hypothetical protein